MEGSRLASGTGAVSYTLVSLRPAVRPPSLPTCDPSVPPWFLSLFHSRCRFPTPLALSGLVWLYIPGL